jgi:hypothetical protein
MKVATMLAKSLRANRTLLPGTVPLVMLRFLEVVLDFEHVPSPPENIDVIG